MNKKEKKGSRNIGIMLLIVTIGLALSGCFGGEHVEVSKEATGNAQSENSLIARSKSTVVNDSKTNSVITYQDSFQIGTYIKISLYGDQEAPTEDFDRIFEAIDLFEKLISKNITTSEISMINANAGKSPVKVSDNIFELIKLGIQYGDVSEGGFDISIGPLVDLWGIGSAEAHLPLEDEINEAIAHINYHDIVLDDAEQTVYLKDEGMSLDLGAIAKGYIADHIKTLIQEEGYQSAIINLGGNVLTVGHKPNSETWSIGVRDPKGESSDIVGILKLQDNSIVSSGTYERYFIDEASGKRYHHILNPKTGYPEDNQLLSVSIISEKSVVGDALSTTVFVMGLDKGYAYIESLDNVEALFIMDDGSIYSTSGIKAIFSLTNNNYTLKEK